MNPFDVNGSADRAVLGGSSADTAMGFPPVRPQAGLRTPQNIMEDARARLDSLKAAAPQQLPSEPVLGFDPATKTIFSGGKSFQADNLTEVGSYAKAGFLDIDNAANIPANMQAVPASKVKAWLARRQGELGVVDDIQRGAAQQVSGLGSAVRDVPGLEGVGQAVQGVGDKIVNNNPARITSPQDILNRPGTFIKQAGGEAVGQLPSMLAGAYGGAALGTALFPGIGTAGGALIGGAIGRFAPTFISEYGQTRQEQRDAGIEDKTRAVGTAAGSAALETAFGPESAIARRLTQQAAQAPLDMLKGGRAMQTLRGTGRSILEEGATEIPQEALGRFGAHQDLTGKEATDAYIMAGASGAVGGGVLGAPISFANSVSPGGPAPAFEVAPPVAPAPTSTELAYYHPSQPTPVEDVTPTQNYGFGAGGTPLLGSPAYIAPEGTQSEMFPRMVTSADLAAENAPGTPNASTGPLGPTGPAPSVAARDNRTPDMFGGELTEAVRVDFTPEAIERELRAGQPARKGITQLSQDLSAALGTPQVQEILDTINNTGKYDRKTLGTPTVEAANDVVARHQSRMLDAQAQEGAARAMPATTAGIAPVDTGESAAAMRETSAQELAPKPIPLDGQIADTDARVSGQQQLASTAERRQILDRILADPATTNPKARFASTLKKLGYRDTKVSESEASAITRHAEITAALNEPEVQAPAGNSAMESLVKERKAPAQTQKAAPKRVNPQLQQPFELVTQSQADLEALDRAKQKRARQAAQPEAPVEESTPDKNQGELFTPKGNVAKAAAVATPAVEVSPKRAKLGLPKDKAPAAVTAAAIAAKHNADIRANPPVENTPEQARMHARIESAYNDDAIDAAETAELHKLVDEHGVPAARAELHRKAEANQGGRTKYRTTKGAGRSAAAQVQKIADDVKADWVNAPEVVVVQSEADLPQKMQDQITKDKVSGKVPGAYFEGRVYLIADNLHSARDVILTMAHEAAGHYGMAGVLQDKLKSTMRRIYAGNAAIRASATEKMEKGASMELAVEETLADMQESETEPTGWARVVTAIKEAVNSLFGKDAFTDKEVRALLKQSRMWVKSGADTAGPTDGGTKFRTAKETVTDAASNVKDKAKYDLADAARRAVLSSSFLRDIGARYAKDFTRVKEYVDRVFKMSAAAGKLQEAAVAVQDAISALGNDKTAVLDLMARVTAANVSVEGDNSHLKDGSAAPLVAEFKALNAKQKAAYRTARDALKANWATRAALLGRTASEVYDPLIEEARAAGNNKQMRVIEREKASFVKDTNARLSEIKGDYFPLMRFGEWSVVRKSEKYAAMEKARGTAFADLQALLNKYDKQTPEERKINTKLNAKLKAAGVDTIDEFTPEQNAGITAARKAHADIQKRLEGMKSSDQDYYVAQFETQSQARADAAAIGGGAYVSRRAEFHKELNPISRQMLSRLEESMAITMKGAGNVNAMREAKKAMFEIYLSSLPELSALKRQAKRKNVAGWHADMQRNIAASMFKDSFYLSRMDHMDDINASLNSVRQEADAKAQRGEAGATDLQGVAAELERRQAASMQFHETPVQDMLSAATYVYFLGVSPGFLIANFLQPFMVSAPMMAARHGMHKTRRAMWESYKDVSSIVTKSIKKNFRGEIDFEGSDISDGEKSMLRHMLQQRLLSVTLTHDLANTAEGREQSRFMKALSLPSHHVEVVNRISTALAAYRMELASTGNAAKATLYAEKILADTHFDYSTENAPYWMKPGVVPLGKLFFQFKKYQLAMISLYVKTMAAALKGESAEVKTEARKALMGLIATHMSVAGLVGLPAFGTVMFFAQMFAEAVGDEPEDMEAELRNFLDAQFGKTLGAAIMKGAPTVAGADLSKKVGAGGLLSAMPMLRETDGGRSMYLEMLASLSGATIGGLGTRFADGIQSVADGKYQRAAEAFMPKFLADPLRGGRFLAEGVQTRGGDTMQKDVAVWDAILTSMGITPSRVADMYAANAAVKGREKALADTSTRIKSEWANADGAGRREIERDLRENLNPIRVANGLAPIHRGSLQQYLNQRTKTNTRYEKLGANVKSAKLAEIGNFGNDEE
jgi:hypothetical protein